MFPRVIFNITQSSVRRGRPKRHPFSKFLPGGEEIRPLHAEPEFGPLGSTIGRSEWIYGFVGGLEVSKTTMLMAELHGTSRMKFHA